MRRVIVPLLFVFLVATAFALTTALPAAADESAKPQHSGGGCSFKAI